ncbi:MAG: WG repeat-containing protein [Bacteroidota bacterium]
MRLIISIFCGLLFAGSVLSAQGVLPVRRDNRWGIIDQQGQILISPQYEQLGWPGAGSSLVVQDGDMLGLFSPDGRALLPTRYEDIQVLDDSLFAVLDDGKWTVRNLDNREVVRSGYEQLRRLGDGYIAYLRNGFWGLARADGTQIVSPEYDRIERTVGNCFLLRSNGKLGLIGPSGRKLLEATATALDVDESSQMLYFKVGGRWGGKSLVSPANFPARYDTYSWLDDYHLTLVSGDHLSVYNKISGQIRELPIGARPISFSRSAVTYRHGSRVGLVVTIGSGELSNEFLELQAFSDRLVRARTTEGWGLLTKSGQSVLGYNYNYIGPVEAGIALAYKNGQIGAIDANGRELLTPLYSRLERSGEQIRAYDGEGNGAALTVFSLNEQGELVESTASERHFRVRVSGQSNSAPTLGRNMSTTADRILPRHEWFYAAEEDRWGLRLHAGEEIISPTFSRILVDLSLGITLVGLPKSTEIEFERTTYRATEIFGLFLNEEGKVVTELTLLHLELDDWRAGNELARCIFENGRYGLIDKQGRIRLRDATYIGPFREGLAPISLRGQLSGSLEQSEQLPILPKISDYLCKWHSTIVLKDYTTYDQQFARDAELSCVDCVWGYVSETGELSIGPRFNGVGEGFVQGRAVVEMETGQGLIDRAGQFIIEPIYENLTPLFGNQDELVYRLTKRETHFGLIDTLGRMRLPTQFEALGTVSADGWVATRKGENWGYVDLENQRVLPDTFLQPGAFVDGLAPVKLLPGWTLIDERGQQVWAELYFDELGELSEGVIWSRQASNWSLLDTEGKQLVQLSDIEQAHAFDHGVARIKTSSGWGLVDRTGQWVERPRYDEIFPFQSNGRAKVRLAGQSDRFGLINEQGQLLSSKAYRSMADFSDGLALVQDQHGYGFIDPSGREVIACNLGPTQSFSEGRAVFQEYGKCGYLDLDGQRVIEPVYSNCLNFNGGLAVVYETMSQAGLIDISGTEVVEPSLNRLLHFQEGRGLVKDTRKGFYFVARNASLYDGYYDFARPYEHGVAIVGYDSQIGLINHKGISLIRPKYGEISDFDGAFAEVRIDRLYGLANAQGQILLEPAYDYLAPAVEGVIRAERGDRIGYLNYAGHWIWALQD